MATTLYIVVTGHGKPEQVERYYYGTTQTYEHATDLATVGRVVSVLAVTEDSEDAAWRSAVMQADRLRSGLYGCEVVETTKAARELVRDAYDVALRSINNN